MYGFSTHEVRCFFPCALSEQRKRSDDALNAWNTDLLEYETSYTENEQSDAEFRVLNTPERCTASEIRMLGLHPRPVLMAPHRENG